jgi:predicted nucleic acid-binding protein
MPDKKQIVINTGLILTLIAGVGSLDALKSLYSEVIVPFKVCYEILAGSSHEFGKK